MTLGGALTTIHNFAGADGAVPYAGLVEGTDGSFYGTTDFGGTSTACSGGCGTVFKIASGGTVTTLHSFVGGPADGARPYAGLVQGTDGSFYGTTFEGGAGTACTYGCGIVFKITSSGMLTTLLSFDYADGAYPSAPLIQATDGNLYGTTAAGGANDFGTAFKITSGGSLTTLHSFCAQTNCGDGFQPYGGLVQATSGTFYGTTYYGGVNNDGIVFSLAVGLGPFVETLPTSGKVGETVVILGNNLTGATSVTFNGTAAVFKVTSPSLITTTVPTGAATGKVKVVTPRRTLSSNVPFRVLPYGNTAIATRSNSMNSGSVHR
jgi:uncharacterized repeat protein (TIGR03803 family)